MAPLSASTTLRPDRIGTLEPRRRAAAQPVLAGEPRRTYSPKGFLPTIHLFGIPVHRRTVVLLFGDLVILALAMYSGHLLRWTNGPTRSLNEILNRTTGASLLFVGSVVFFLYVLDCYSPRADFRALPATIRLIACIAGAALLQMAAYYLLPQWRWFRAETVLSLTVLLPSMVAWRVSASKTLTLQMGPTPVVIVGTDAKAATLGEVFRERDEYGHNYELLGFVSDHSPTPDSPLEPVPGPVLGTATELVPLVYEHGIREIVVTDRRRLSPEMTRALLSLKQLGLQITDLPTAYQRLTGKVLVTEIHDLWVIFALDFPGVRPLYKGVLRLADVLIASVGLLLCLPLLAVAALVIKCGSKGPVLFVQQRLGFNEQPFNLLKLRTMTDHAERNTGPVWSGGASDTRVTSVGRLLRRTRIDETPQLWNVLRGEMSIVGPRPERQFFVSQLKAKIPYYALRFAAKPGITGWAQVAYRYAASEEDSLEKLQYDLYAIQEMSPALYLIVLFKTVQTVFMRPGS